MSGGHWDSSIFVSLDQAGVISAHCSSIMSWMLYSLDRGHAGDDCLECAKVRIIAALEAFFDGRLGDDGAREAIQILSRRRDFYCEKCKKESK